MKAYRTIIVLVFSLTYYSGHTQTYAPVGSYWVYHYTTPSTFEYKDMYLITGDSVAGNCIYKKMKLTREVIAGFPPPPTIGTIYTWDNLIGVKYCNDSVFSGNRLLYHFNMIQGDTFYYQTQAQDSAYFVVDTVYNIALNSITLKKWEITRYYSCFLTTKDSIIEKIGPIGDFMTLQEDYCIGSYWWNLICYNGLTFQYNEPCGTVGINEKEIVSGKSIYPNPVSDRLFLADEFLNIDFEITDIHGRKMGFGKYQGSIDVSEMATGIYFIRISGKNGSFYQRFIKN
ncbi:MAG: T9SS type A sorting domain-containing protein [Bacteroidota bacterium]